MPYHVYVLECSDGTYYTGVTRNVERRFQQHQAGVHPKAYTFTRRPVKLKWAVSFTRIDHAIEVEKQIKRWSSKKKAALIENDWDLISQLAKKDFSK